MNSFKKSLSALALVATIAGGFGVATLAGNPAWAEPGQTAPSTPGAGWHHHKGHGMDRMRFIEGRVAFLKAVLKITPAQEADFNKFADAMRANAQDRMSTWKEMRETHVKDPMNAVDRLAARTHFTQMRAQADQRLLAAFKPLYAALAPDQQKIADRLAAMMTHRARHHGMHHGDR